MYNFWEVFFRFANGLVTVSFLPFLYLIYLKNNRRFYLIWGIGFFLYGLNIIIRAVLSVLGLEDSVGALMFSYVFNLGGLIIIIAGIGDLINRAKRAFIATLILPFLIGILYFTTRPTEIGWAISLSPYLFICAFLLYIRAKYSAPLDLLIIGWAILILANIAVPINLMNRTYVEIWAILAKAIIFFGMTYPRFNFLAEDLKRFLISGIPSVYPEETPGNINLLNFKGDQRREEIQWLKDRIQKNSLQAVRTILITAYDLISLGDLRSSGIDERDLYLIRMLPGQRSNIDAFEGQVININDDLNELDIIFSQIIDISNEKKINCEIFLYTLSTLIHTHGWRRVYSFLLSKIPQLKTSNVHLFAIFYPESHTNKSDIVKFQKLADSSLTI